MLRRKPLNGRAKLKALRGKTGIVRNQDSFNYQDSSLLEPSPLFCTAIYEMVTHNNSINRTPQKLRFLGALRASAPVMANIRYLEFVCA